MTGHLAGPDDGLAGAGEGRHRKTACTERHPAAPDDGLAGEGRKRRHPAAAGSGLAGEGRQGRNDLAMRKVGTA